jgi:putative hydrolases of HD superfamily
MDTMIEINKLKIFNELKSVYRFNSVAKRKESSAEHTWSSMILADFFLTKFPEKIDRLKVYELLLYHDVVEIAAGDSPLHLVDDIKDKKKKEEKAASLLQKRLPIPLNDKFLKLFNEFEDQKTKEAKYAKAIDGLDAIIQELDYKKDWKGWTAKFLVGKKSHLFEDFPGLKGAFETILKFLIKNNYLDS